MSDYLLSVVEQLNTTIEAGHTKIDKLYRQTQLYARVIQLLEYAETFPTGSESYKRFRANAEDIKGQLRLEQ